MAILLRILTILCLMEMMSALSVSKIKSQYRDIEEKSDCQWSHFCSGFNSLERAFQALTLKIDALTEKVDRALNGKECPIGFDYLPEIDQCLKLSTAKMTWIQAHAACQTMAKGGQLMTITDSVKQDAVKRYLNKQFTKPETSVCVMPEWTGAGQSTWISGQRKIADRCDTPFVWKYKQGVEVPFAFTKWSAGEPNCDGNNEQCVHIASGLDYGWNDIPCARSLCFVCEI